MTGSQNSWEQIWKLLVTVSRGIFPHDAKSRRTWLMYGDLGFAMWHRSRLGGPASSLDD